MLRRRALALRNRLLSSARLRSFSNRFWPARLVARSQARELFDVIAGFTYSQVLFACVRLGVFDRLSNATATVEQLAHDSELTPAAWRDLLRAADSLHLVECIADDEYTLGRLGVVMAADRSLQAMVLHHDNLYRDLVDPVALLRGDLPGSELGSYWPYATKDTVSDEAAARYSALMAASQPMVAEQVLGAFSFAHYKTLLDVGGGSGAFVRAVAKKATHLDVQVFDLPPVAKLASESLESAGLAERSTVHGGDFRADALPAGADLISLIRIAHDHDDDTVLILLKKIREALAPGGTLLIAEPMAGTAYARRMGDAYFRFYLMAMGTGRPRTFEELSILLQSSGFGSIEKHPTAIPMLAQVVSAKCNA
ncbi:MAG: methyltransferase [Gammaproteobacteria bacterium]